MKMPATSPLVDYKVEMLIKLCEGENAILEQISWDR